MKIYINGKFYSKENATVSVYDHGFLYGDGAFEGIRAYERRVFRLDEHIARLYETCHTMMIKIPLTKNEMEKAIVSTLKENKIENGYIRAIVTRGGRRSWP